MQSRTLTSSCAPRDWQGLQASPGNHPFPEEQLTRRNCSAFSATMMTDITIEDENDAGNGKAAGFDRGHPEQPRLETKRLERERRQIQQRPERESEVGPRCSHLSWKHSPNALMYQRCLKRNVFIDVCVVCWSQYCWGCKRVLVRDVQTRCPHALMNYNDGQERCQRCGFGKGYSTRKCIAHGHAKCAAGEGVQQDIHKRV